MSLACPWRAGCDRQSAPSRKTSRPCGNVSSRAKTPARNDHIASRYPHIIAVSKRDFRFATILRHTVTSGAVVLNINLWQNKCCAKISDDRFEYLNGKVVLADSLT